ncbi:hypothetical protein AB3S75_021925 [Citrus x aurantiifolia]
MGPGGSGGPGGPGGPWGPGPGGPGFWPGPGGPGFFPGFGGCADAYTVSAAVGCYKIASVEPVAPTVPHHSDFFTVGRSVDIFLLLFAARFSFGDPMAPFSTLMACCYFFCLRKLLPTYVVALSVDY